MMTAAFGKDHQPPARHVLLSDIASPGALLIGNLSQGTSPMVTIPGVDATFLSSRTGGDVVEIALLLPLERVEALMVLAEKRRQSVGQVVRRLIDRALAADE